MRTPPTEGGRILVVDDNEMNRDMLSRRLVKRGHLVEVADGGVSALAMIKTADFDLVLLDIMMPGMDGYEVLDRIRVDHAGGDLPVIMATARDESEDIVSALRKGANDYVTKPFDFPVVMARVTTQLALKRSRQALATANLRMKRDLEAAAKIQQAFLPPPAVSVSGATFAWRYLPCDELAGDTLNIVPLDEHHVAFFVVDVRGHGVPAALMSVALSRLMSPAAGSSSILWARDSRHGEPRIASPIEVAYELAKRFPYDQDTGQYFTLLYGVLDLEAQELRFVSAGHPYLAHVSSGNPPEFCESTGAPIGLIPEVLAAPVFSETTLALSSGDRIYVYSDGIPEAAGPDGEEFGDERLTETLGDLGEHDLEGSIQVLLDRVAAFSERPDFEDDVSVISFQVG